MLHSRVRHLRSRPHSIAFDGSVGSRAASLRRLVASAAALAVILPSIAVASVVGTPPVLWRQYEVRGSANVIGNTVMSYQHDPRINSLLLDPQWTRSELRNVPLDATVEGAYVFYSARMDQLVDYNFRFHRPDGVVRNLTADRCISLVQFNETFYYCRKDVTAELAQVDDSLGHLNGFYNVQDFDARAGVLGSLSNGCHISDINCQAAYGGWSLVIFWSSPSYPKVRNLNLYDGFLAMYEDNTSGISPPIQLSGFNVGDPAVGELAFFALEGDPHLGHPPLGPEWADFMYFTGQSGASMKLQDAVNPPDNLFNSTVPESGVAFNGIDLDRFDIGEGGLDLLAPGETTGWIQPGAGDGNPNYAGEFFILAWVMLAIDTITPEFGAASSKVVDRTVAAAGDTLTYTITVENTGSQIATDVVVQDSLPPGTIYVPGSTAMDGQPVADIGGQSALAGGLNIGTLDYRVGTTRKRTLTWQARVSPSVSDGSQICNTATVDSSEGAFTTLTTSPCTTVSAPELVNPPLLAVESRDGEPVEPGFRLRYRATIENAGAQAARNVTYRQDLPPYVKGLELITVPMGSTDSSVSTGGSNGTGVIDVTDITVPGSFAVEIVYDLIIYDYFELVGAGVPPSTIDGLQISTQGLVSAPWISSSMLTDDPATLASPDPTTVVLSWPTDLSTSTKTGVDVDGGLFEPGDTVAYEIAVRNTGRAPATAHVIDDLPIGVEDCTIIEAPPGTQCSSSGGANDSGELTAGGFIVGSDEVVFIRYTVRVRDDVPDRTIVRNRAVITLDESLEETVVRAAPLEVFARPLLHTSTKAVFGHQGRIVEPGDQLTYSITVNNTGNRPATGVVVGDHLDAALTSIVPLDGGSLDGRTISWSSSGTPSLAIVEPGESVTVGFTAVVALPLDDGTVIANQASIVSDQISVPELTGDADTPDQSDPTVVIVSSAPILETTTKAVENLSGSLSEIRPGHRLRYTIVLRNTGTAEGGNVVVTDPIDANLTMVEALDGGVVIAESVRWNIGDLGVSPAGDVTLRFEATVQHGLPNGTVISNQAVVDADNLAATAYSGDPRTPVLGDPTLVTVTSDAILSSTKAVTDLDGGATLPGDRLEYRIVLSSIGDAPVRDITVVDPIEACLTDVVVFDGGVFDGSNITWSPQTSPGLTQLFPGHTIELRFRASVAPGTPNGTACANQAFASSPDITTVVPSGDPRTPAEDDPTIVIVESRPVLEESTKAVDLLDDRNGDGAYSPGDRIRYTLLIRNTGTETATDVVVIDPLPSELTNVSVSGGGVVIGQEVRWSIGTMVPGADRTLLVDADVLIPLDDGTVVENQGRIEWSGMPAPALTGDPSTAVENDPTRFTLVASPVFEETTKAVSFPAGEPARPGHELDYEIRVRNTGTSLARDVVVTDVLDENLVFVSAGQGGSFDPATRTVNWQPGTIGLSPEGDFVSSLRVRIESPLDNGTIVDNQAFVSSAEITEQVPSGDPRTPQLGDPTRVIIVAGSDLTSSTKTVDAEGGIVVPGQLLTWTLTVKNEGDAIARNVVVTDPVDPSLTEITVGQGGQVSFDQITWNASGMPALQAIAPGEEAVLTFASRVVFPLDDGTIIENQGWISADDLAEPTPTTDPGTPAPFDPTRVTVRSSTDLSGVTKATGSDSASPGDTVTWTIRLTNSGDMVARGLVVTDQLDPNLEFLSATQGGIYDSTSRTVTWSIPELGISPQGDLDLTLQTRVSFPLDNGTIVSNQAFVQAEGMTESFPTSDPRSPELGDPTDVVIESAPVLVFTKSAENALGQVGPGKAEPGDRITYTLVIENEGDMVAWGTEISDLVHAAFVDVMVDSGSFDPTTLTASWPPLDVVPGEPVVRRIEATVAPLTAGGTIIENQALALGAGESIPSSDLSNPGAGEPTVIEVVAAPVLTTSTKTVVDEDGGLVRPGDWLTWTIVVRNTGNTYATEVIVEDAIDPWLIDVEPGQGGVVQGGFIRWDFATTPALSSVSPEPGGEVSLSFRSRIRSDAPDGTIIRNQALIRSAEISEQVPTGDPSTPEPGDPTEIMVSIPVLSAAKTVVNESGGEVSPQDILRWTIELRNEGSHEANAILARDPIDTAGLIEISPEDGGVFDGDTITWLLGTLPPGGSTFVSFTSRVRPLLANGTVIANQAFVSSAEIDQEIPSYDPSTPAPDDPTIVTVTASPDFRGASKSVENMTGRDDQVRPGDRLRYTITFENSGNTLATNVEILDIVDPNLLDVTLDPPGKLDGERATWTSASLPELSSVAPGEVIGVHIEGTVRSPLEHGTRVENQAVLISAESTEGWRTGDPRTPAEADPTVVTIWSAPRLSRSEKSVENLDGSVDWVSGGDLLEYTLVIVNDGTEDAYGAVLVDDVPSWTSYVRGSTSLNGRPVQDGPGGASPLAAGLTVQSSRPGTPSGIVLVDDGVAPDDEVAVVVFRVRVEPDVPGGTVISNQGRVSSDRTPAVGTGDPRTPEIGDPTIVIVGEALHLSGTTKTWSLVEDLETPGVVEPGDSVAYEITIVNRGNVAAREIHFTDELPDGVDYIEDTLTLDGVPLFETGSVQGGSVHEGVVRVTIIEVPPGARRVIRFEVRVREDAPSILVNQGIVRAQGPDGRDVEELTDADPSTPGAQPTVIPVGDAPSRDLSTSTKSVSDIDGGRVEPGDTLRYTIVARNAGNAPISNVTVGDDIPDHTTYLRVDAPVDTVHSFEEAPAGAHRRGRLLIALNRPLGPGEALPISFLVVVDGNAPNGTIIENAAMIDGNGAEPVQTETVRVMVGGAIGTGGLTGRVYRDLQGTGSLDAGDPVFPGFTVIARPPRQLRDGGGPGASFETSVDSQGRYLLVGLPPRDYELHFLSPTGTSFGKSEPLDVLEEEIGDYDGLIDPSGVIYRGGTAEGIPGAAVYLLYDDSRVGEAPLPCDEDQSPIALQTDPDLGASEERPLPRPVGAACLPEGQQGQSTPSGDAAGFYRFDLPVSDPPMAYRMTVVPPAPRLAFPSITILPQPDFAPPGPAVESPTPDPEGAVDYWLRFRIGSAEDEVTNNHVPLDQLESLVAVRKVAGKSTASVGDLVPYTVTVTNRSGRDIEAITGLGAGLTIRDLVPDGMRYVRGSSRASRVARDAGGVERHLCPRVGEDAVGCPSQRLDPASLVDEASGPTIGQILDYGPFDLPAGQSLLIRYTLVVAADASPGERVNRAAALLDGALLGEARATLRVVPDPLFDQATLYGKVYCDDGADGVQDPGDRGLAGVRVHADVGHYAVTDGAGKWHLQRLPAGMRLFKVDERSLPPGTRLLDPAARPIHVTPGLDTTLNWRASCSLLPVAPESVDVLVERRSPEVDIIGNALGLGMTVADEPVPIVRADVRLSLEPIEPDFRGPADAPLDVLPLDDLHFHTKVTGPIAHWRFVMSALPDGPAARGEPREWDEVFAQEGEGRPPDNLRISEGASELEARRLYAYWLIVVGEEGVAARSPVRTMGVAYGEPAQEPVEMVVDEVEGSIFSRRSLVLDGLAQELEKVREDLEDDPRRRVEIRVHVDAGMGDRAEPVSEARAAAVFSWLVDRGIDPDRIDAKGLGGSYPSVPNIGARNQASNRRVAIVVVPPELPVVEVPTLTFQPRAVVGGVGTVVPDERGSFKLRLEVPVDGRVIAGLRRADGATLGAAVLVDREGRLVSVDEDLRGTLAGWARAAAEGEVPEAMIRPPTSTPPSRDGPGPSEDSRPEEAGRPKLAVRLQMPLDGAPGRVEIGGRIFPLPFMGSMVEAEESVVRLDEAGALQAPLSLSAQAPLGVIRWKLEIGPAGEEAIEAASGLGTVPSSLSWDGAGADFEAGSLWSYRLYVQDAEGNEGRSAKGFFLVAMEPLVEVHRELIGASGITETGADVLRGLAAAFEEREEGSVLRIEVHTDPNGGEAAALARSRRLARTIEQALAEMGVPQAAIASEGRGAGEPVVPNLNARNRALNNRVVVAVEPASPPLPAVETAARVVIGEIAARREDAHQWAAELDRLPSSLEITITTEDGRESVYRIALPEEARRPVSMEFRSQPPVRFAGGESMAGGAGGGFFGRAFRVPLIGGVKAPVLLAQGTQLDEMEEDEVSPTAPGTGTVLGEDSELPESVEEEGDDVSVEDEVKPLPSPDEVEVEEDDPPVPEEREVELVHERRSIDDVDLSAVPAARTLVYLPPAGEPVGFDTLGLSGETVPGNRVAVNGRDVSVSADGHFFAVVDIPRGESMLVVQITDPDGNEATISREVVSEPDGVFVMAMADTHMGRTGAELAGVTDRTSVALGPVYLHGRGVAYAKGSWRLERGLFHDLSLTLHLDTGKEKEASYFADLVGTDRHYPIYGDSAQEIQDVASLGPVFVSAKADANELRIGSFRTDPGVGGLFSYRRTFYGVQLAVDQPLISGKLRTRGEIFVADDPAGVRPGHVVIQGTGGSLYFMRHRDLVEGSERARVVVRDRDTGAEITSRMLTRNVDYIVRHREGHLMLMAPLPSVVEAGWMAGFNLASTLDGHPVFLVVDYEHLAEPGEGGLAVGGYITETFLDWITLGGGMLAQEDGTGADPYRLWGLSAELRPRPKTFLRAEMAQSSGADVSGFYSADGGLSYSSLLPSCVGPAERSAICRDGGNAYKLELGGTLGDLIGGESDVVTAGAHLHFQDRGFNGSQLLMEQGQRRVGANLAWEISDKDQLSARLDRVASEVPIGLVSDGVGPTREVVRAYSGLRYQRTEERWRVAGEYGYGSVRDPAADLEVDVLGTHRLAAGGEYDLDERLSLVLEQDLVLGGDARMFEDWNSRLTTTLGARWLLTDSLRLSALGRLRWNGENSALVGVETRTGQSGSLYARQRFTRLAGGAGWRSATILGGEQRLPGGVRSYGEYQLDGGMSGQHGRAVLGVSNRWLPWEGVSLGLAYERVQVMGDPGMGAAVPGSTIDPITGRSSTGGRVDGLPPYDAVGTNPAGAFHPGAVSRDAVSGSAELLRDGLKASARLELRYDDADDELAGTVPGLADRLQTVALANVAWTWTRDLSAIARFNYAGTDNLTRREEGLESREALWVEATGGLAFRPAGYDFINVLAKYTRLIDQRPMELSLGTSDRHSSHVFSLAPVLRTPWRATLSEKIAYKNTRMQVGLGEAEASRPPEATAHTLLWINRVDFHVLPRFDLTGEYRVLWVGAEDGAGGISATTKSGLVLELAWRAAEYLRLGIGYSFADFSDDELSRFDRNERGFFLRVTGMY